MNIKQISSIFFLIIGAGLIAFAAKSFLFPVSSNPASSSTTPSTNSSKPVSSSNARSTSSTATLHTTRAIIAPPTPDPNNIYAATNVGMFNMNVRDVPERVYVPNSKSNTVSVIDPGTFKVLETFPVDGEPMHIVPAWDLKTLWVADDLGNTLIAIDPMTSRPRQKVHVRDPYNLYFTPDGQYAIVVAEYQRRLEFLNPRSMTSEFMINVLCQGINHMDFSADGSYLIAACEFSGDLLKIDLKSRKIIGKLKLGGVLQDVKLAPEGKVFFVADMKANGVYLIDGERLEKLAFLHTGKGTHGLYISRDTSKLYITNRAEGSVSVMKLSTRELEAKWWIPGGGSPDMGSVSADGRQLWLTGRTNGEVYVFDTRSGKLEARIKVGKGPHGLTFFPQPGRFSLGHTGVYR
jgi:YVTN family beta-propeller protein